VRDYDLLFDDRPDEPLEVTRFADQAVMQTWARLERADREAPACSSEPTCCQNQQPAADTKRTHQKQHARRLATHPGRLDRADLQEKLCRG